MKKTITKYLAFKTLYDCEYGFKAKEVAEHVYEKCFLSKCNDDCKNCQWNPVRAAIAWAVHPKTGTSVRVLATFISEAAIKIVAETDAANKNKGPNLVFRAKSDKEPIDSFDGTGHCVCKGNGEFVRLKKEQGQKQYYRCRKCGCYTH